MNKFYTICIFLLFISGTLHSQKIGIEPFAGYGSSSMKGLKDLLTLQSENSEVPLKVVDNFASQPNLGFQFYFSLDNYNQTDVGIRYSHYSTGGKAHYEDYSGELSFEIITTGSSLGVFTRMNFLDHEKFILKGSICGSIYFSSVNLVTHLRVYEESNSQKLDFASKSLVLEPFIEPSYFISKSSRSLYLGARLGVALDIGGEIHLKDNRDVTLLDEKDEAIRTNWSGFRGELFVGFCFL